jgi:two-component system OmpR family response regulator
VAKSPQHSISILLIEDHQDVCEILVQELRAEGWHVDVCTEGHTASKVIESDQHYDIIVTDNDLPFLTGVELVELARQMVHRKDTPILMLSGDLCKAEALQAGADAFLSKPSDVGRLVQTVLELINSPRHRVSATS